MKTIAKLILFVFLFSLYTGLDAKASEFKLWTESGIRYKINKKFTVGFDQKFRLDNDAQGIESIGEEFFLRFRLSRVVRLSGGYRFTIEPLTSHKNYWHRFYVDSRFRLRLKRLRLDYRIRYHEEFGSELKTGGREFTMEHTLRNKITASLNLKKGFSPFVSAELHGRFADNDGFLHKWRFSAGLDYSFKRNTFSLYYIGEDMLNGDTTTPFANILGLSYNYSF